MPLFLRFGFLVPFGHIVPEDLVKGGGQGDGQQHAADAQHFYFLETLHNCFRRFVVGQCTEAVILGLLCMAGMLMEEPTTLG